MASVDTAAVYSTLYYVIDLPGFSFFKLSISPALIIRLIKITFYKVDSRTYAIHTWHVVGGLSLFSAPETFTSYDTSMSDLIVVVDK